MKNKILLFLTAVTVGAVCFSSCKENEMDPYKLKDIALNFYLPDPMTANPYPDELVTTVKFGMMLPDDNGNVIAELPIDVQTQGYNNTVDRKVFFMVDSVAYGPDINFVGEQDFMIPANESTGKFMLQVKEIAPATTAKAYLAIDYDKSDFTRGVNERQLYEIVLDNNVALEDVGLSQMFWDWDYVWTFGPWSSAKGRFIIVTLKITNFWLLNPWTNDHVILLRNALAEYKALSEADPVTYPPYYESGTTWISF